MPICRFQLKQSAGGSARLGWVDRERERAFEISGTLGNLLRLHATERLERVVALRRSNVGSYPLTAVTLVAPVDEQEIWAAGVTYARSRDARMEESTQEDVYARVYGAERPELFYKAAAWRCVGPGARVGIRGDSNWNVPEPELTLVIDSNGDIAGYTIGNDVSSRSIEGENPLYLPQAKSYFACCALGPWIVLPEELDEPAQLPIQITIERNGGQIWSGTTSTANMHRTFDDLVSYLYRALDFPAGALLMTGTGLVPPAEFTLQQDDIVRIEIEGIGTLENRVAVVAVRGQG
jgi:2-dehydro-3-deoxy-D-arabinonate dehydratase